MTISTTRDARECARTCPAISRKSGRICHVIMAVLGIVALFGWAAQTANAEGAKPQAASPEPIQFEQETLPNGLRVIYAPLHQAPVVHVRMLYHVGSRHERPARQGFAQMFERI